MCREVHEARMWIQQKEKSRRMHKEARSDARVQMFDPLDFTLLVWFHQDIDAPAQESLQRSAIIGAGTSHLEALYLEIVRVYRATRHHDELSQGFFECKSLETLAKDCSMHDIVQRKRALPSAVQSIKWLRFRLVGGGGKAHGLCVKFHGLQ